jgi:hypothetical protein
VVLVPQSADDSDIADDASNENGGFDDDEIETSGTDSTPNAQYGDEDNESADQGLNMEFQEELESDNFSETRDAMGSPDLVDNGNGDSGSACESDSEVKRERQFYCIFHVKAST